MINKFQFASIIRRVLTSNTGPAYHAGDYDAFNSQAAINLLMGTAMAESRMGTYIRQVRGPALGVFQMEPETFKWLQNLYGERYGFEFAGAPELEVDLRLSILTARLRYWVDRNRLPQPNDLLGLAGYWKRVYNTYLGAGDPAKFVKLYRRYIGRFDL